MRLREALEVFWFRGEVVDTGQSALLIKRKGGLDRNIRVATALANPAFEWGVELRMAQFAEVF